MSDSAPTVGTEPITGGLTFGAEYQAAHREVAASVKSIREQWREQLEKSKMLRAGSRLSERAGVLRINLDTLDERIAEAGGEDGLVFMLCAQVASGVTLTEWCRYYDLERGLVWAFLSEDEKRLARYYRAQEGVADEYVADTVGIADRSDVETVQVDKLRVVTRMKVAAKYDRKRFGEKEINGGAGGITVIVQRGGGSSESALECGTEPPLGNSLEITDEGQTLLIGG